MKYILFNMNTSVIVYFILHLIKKYFFGANLPINRRDIKGLQISFFNFKNPITILEISTELKILS